MSDWDYNALWWNCQDMAIRLAYLLVPSNSWWLETTLRSLKRTTLEHCRSVVNQSSATGVSAFTFGCVLAAILGGPLAAPIALTGFGTFMATSLGTIGSRELHPHHIRGLDGVTKSRQNMERMFPSLRLLHERMASSSNIYVAR